MYAKNCNIQRNIFVHFDFYIILSGILHDFWRHFPAGSLWILNYKPSKILDFPNMTRLWEVITFLLGRVEKKNGPSMRIYATRSFDCAYFQLHRSTSSGRKSSLKICNFENSRIWRRGPPYKVQQMTAMSFQRAACMHT